MHRHSSIDDDGRCDHESSNEEDRKTPTNFVDESCSGSESGFPAVCPSLVDENSSTDFRRTSSLVDELLNEIYARFGDVSRKDSMISG